MSNFSLEDKQKMVYLVKSNQRSYENVARRYNTTPDVIKNIVYELYYGKSLEELKREEKKKFDELNENKKIEVFENRIPEIHENDWGGETTITFGLMGDTQLNSKYTQLTYLHNFYDIIASRGITKVYHTGDIDEGEQMRMGHQYECYTQGVDEHVNEIVKNYPKRDGVTTYFITGNHDASITRRCGCNIGNMIASRREDMKYLGQDCAIVNLTPNCTLELRHPWDGTAYSLSYKMQKIIESMEADSKPNILAVGHYHKIEQLFYRNVHAFQTGTFQGQTPFTRGKGISVHMGGWIITVKVDKNGNITNLTSELIPYYKSIKDDWKNWR